MKRLLKLRGDRKAHVAKMRAHLDAAGDNPLTEDQDREYKAMEASLGQLDASIAREEQLSAAEDREATAAATQPRARGRVGVAGEGDPARGFASHRHFLLAVIEAGECTGRDQVGDERLRSLAVVDDEKKANGQLAFALPTAFAPPRGAAGSDEQGEYADQYGGFSLVSSRLAPRPLVGFEGDPTAGRVEDLPMATPMVEIPAATDKDHSSSVSAGLTISRRPETAAMTASRQKMEMITLKATGSYGLSYASEELLADSPISWIARLSNGFELQWAAFTLNERLRGAGGNERLGVLTALASATLGPTISIAKESGQAADTIGYSNVIKMRSRCWGYGNAIWLANHDCYPQLAVLAIPVGVGGQLVYQQSLVEDRPDMLLGRPIFYTEYASTIGDQGDLILGNWSQYLDGVYQPIQSAESIHVRFLNNERALRFTKRDCGAPSWRVPLTPNKSAQTLSPFVVLDAR
jgi:hypothetical protein